MSVIDYSFFRPHVADVAAAGFTGVVRYLGGDARLTLSEATELRAHGLDIGLVWETDPARVLRGYAAGVDDAHNAEREATALGYPFDATIYYAVDLDVRHTLGAVFAYFAGVASVARRPIGCYGPDIVFMPLLDDGVIIHAWQAAASSWSDAYPSPRAHLVQLVGEPVELGGRYDANTVQSEQWGQWRARPQRPKEIPMGCIIQTPSSIAYVDGFVIEDTNGRVDEYLARGVPGPFHRSDEWLAALHAALGNLIAAAAPSPVPELKVDVDETAIAEQVADALGEDLAGDVVDELVERLDPDRPKVWTSDRTGVRYADDDLTEGVN